MFENPYIILTEKDWEKATPEQRDWLIYSTLKNMSQRLEELENKAMFDRVCAFFGGAVGGALVSLGVKWKV